MMEWITNAHNSWFAVAFTVMLCFALLEALSLLLGLGISEWLGKLLPGMPDADAHVVVHADATTGAAPLPDHAGDVSHGHSHTQAHADAGWLASFLSWLEIGRLPFLVSLNVLLATFSLAGFLIQGLLHAVGLPMLPAWLAALIAFVICLPVVKITNRALGKIWPGDESSAFPVESLIGRVGNVTIGTATTERAAEVKVIGPDGKPHYLMVFATAEPLPQGSEVQITARIPGTSSFKGVLNTDPNLSPKNFT